MYELECLTEGNGTYNLECDPYDGACNPDVYGCCGPGCPPV